METVFVSMICIALIVVGGMTMAGGFLNSLDNTSANIDLVSQRNEQIMRTNLSIVEVNQISSYRVEVVVENSGQVKLAEFNKWDVIVHHSGDDEKDYVTWLPYTSGNPDDNEWSVEGIYTLTGTEEVFEPNILNPGEEMIMEIRLYPGIYPESENLINITTPNGVTVSKTFTGNN
jgi:hypothetical protein